MTERYFPFTSVDDDRLYTSADFRSFINSILGSGRCDYEEFNILAVDSLQCSIDSLELDMINISAGACIIKGAGYQSSSAETREVNLPTGSNIYNGYVIARLDPNNNRRISTIISEQFIPETDLILATVKANNVQIIELVNTENVVYSKYNLNPTQFETLITNLALNQDLVAQLANNPNLKNEIISELENEIISESELQALQADIENKIGNLSSLITTEKSNLVGAVNETESSISSLYSSVNEMRLHPMKYADIEIDSEGSGPPTATLSLKSSVDAIQFYKPLTYTFYRHVMTGSPPHTPPSPSQAIYEQAQTGTNNVYEGTAYDRWVFGKITDVSGRSVVSGYYLLPADES